MEKVPEKSSVRHPCEKARRMTEKCDMHPWQTRRATCSLAYFAEVAFGYEG